jgi:hypothetical protein
VAVEGSVAAVDPGEVEHHLLLKSRSVVPMASFLELVYGEKKLQRI